ncbi:MAG TPA: uracil-DNA glycosylase [Terriglobales bacterium]
MPAASPAAPIAAHPPGALATLQCEVAACALCPRLREYGDRIARERRRAFANETYWGRPVPAFGDPQARLLIVGLAPAAHGAHRTGRMFTGDRSGDFLYAALYRAGFASAPVSRHRDDGLRLHSAYLTAAARCAPPGNKPLPEEFARCRPYLARELELLPRLQVILSLGKLAHDQVLLVLQQKLGFPRRSAYPFAHGAEYRIGAFRLLASYHPSQQNTFTGRLTAAMLDEVLARAAGRGRWAL